MKRLIFCIFILLCFGGISKTFGQEKDFNNQNGIQLIINQSYFQKAKIENSIGNEILDVKGNRNMSLAIGYIHRLENNYFLNLELGFSFLKNTFILNFKDGSTVNDTTYQDLPTTYLGQVESLPFIGFGIGKSWVREKFCFDAKVFGRLNLFEQSRRGFGVSTDSADVIIPVFSVYQGGKDLRAFETTFSGAIKIGVSRNTSKRSNLQINLFANYSFSTFAKGYYEFPRSHDKSRGDLAYRLNMVGMEFVYNFRIIY
jgi:hypothetical protein